MKHSKLPLSFVLAGLCAVFLAGALPAQDADPASTNQSAEVATDAEPAMDAQAEISEAETESATPPESEPPPNTRRRGRPADPIVVFGEDAILKAGRTAEAIVVIGGNAKVDGNVNAAVVAIMGDVELNGEVRDAVVAVLGNIKLGPGAKVHGDAVSVGGRIDAAPDAVISGHTQSVAFHFAGLPELPWLREYIVKGVFMLRPLPPQVGWAWVMAGIILFFYFLVAAIFPRPVQACVEELTRRPATTFLMGFLTKLLMPLVILVLAVTGIGIVVVPFIVAVLLVAGIVGKVALLEWIGLRIGANFGESFRKPLLAFVIGAIVLLVLYMIPVLGFLTLFVTSVWAIGCAITAMFGGIRRETPQTAVPPPAGGASERPVMAMAATPPYVASETPVAPVGPGRFGAATAGMTAAAAVPPSASAPMGPGQPELVGAAALTPPLLPESLSYPRAGFWERLGAGFLDIILVSIVSSFVGGTPMGFLVALAYFAGMWTWKGTTIGGIVLGLKVVRADGEPVTFAVAIIRGLAAAFSIIVLFLGFLWIAWDPDKQGWHDRIAGTVVIRLPRGTPLLTL